MLTRQHTEAQRIECLPPSQQLHGRDGGDLLPQLLRDRHAHRHHAGGRPVDADLHDGRLDGHEGELAAARADEVRADFRQHLRETGRKEGRGEEGGGEGG